MGLDVGSTPVTGVYVGSTPVTGIYAGTSLGYDLIWKPGGVVRITGTVDYESRDQFRQALTDRGLDYTTITEVPFYMDTSKATNLRFLFDGCANLVTAPELDTSNATTTRNMFQGCSSLAVAPALDTSKSTDMGYMFHGCANLVTAPDLDTSNVTSMIYMFYGCSALTSAPAMDTSNVTDMSYLFRDCTSLTSVPAMDTSNVTDMTSMFFGCSALTVAPAMDTQNVTTMFSMFRDCPSLAYVPDLQTLNVTTVYAMFYNSPAITDGNVRLIGEKAGVNIEFAITNSGLTRVPFFTAKVADRSYTTSFNFGQTGDVSLHSNSNWLNYGAAGTFYLLAEVGGGVKSSYSTDVGSKFPSAVWATPTAGDDQSVTIRWSEPWEDGQMSGLVMASDTAYLGAASSQFIFWAKRGVAGFRTLTANTYAPRKSYTGAEPAVGDDFTVTREVSGTTQTFTVYINGVYQDHWVDTEQFVPIRGTRRYCGVISEYRRVDSSLLYYGPRINYFSAKDL